MQKDLIDMIEPYLPKSFLDAKNEAEREEKQFGNVKDLDDRVHEKMQSVFWHD